MAEHSSYETNKVYPNLSPNLSDDLQFRLNKINEIRDYFKERELMSKRPSKYIDFFSYFDKSLIVLSVTTGSISIASFATVAGAAVGIVSASFSLAFSISTGLIKKLLKATRSKKKKHNEIIILARSKLNSIENKISKVLINNKISHQDFERIIDEERKYRKLKESIKMMNNQRSDAEKINLIEEGKKISINEVIKHNEIINNCLKP